MYITGCKREGFDREQGDQETWTNGMRGERARLRARDLAVVEERPAAGRFASDTTARGSPQATSAPAPSPPAQEGSLTTTQGCPDR